MPTSSGLEADLDYAAREVRGNDYDRWFSTLFAPAEKRAALLALYAFNLELARAAEQVREPMLGRIRLQWWREALAEAAAGRPRAQPVARLLAAAVPPVAVLEQMIATRERELDPDGFATVAEVEAHARETGGALVIAAAVLLTGAEPPAAEPAGAAMALTGLLRNLHHLAPRGRLLLPRDLLARRGVLPEEVGQGHKPDLVRAVRAEIAARAEALFAEALALGAPRAARPAFLPVAVARLHLKAMQRAGFDPAAPTPSLFRRQTRMLGTALFGRV
jgi:phytoene synthase